MKIRKLFGIGVLVALGTAQSSWAQTTPTFDYKDMVITEGVGLVEKATNTKYIAVGMSKKRVRANAPQLSCPSAADYCAVSTSAETGDIYLTFDAEQKVTQLILDQDRAPHKWPSRKGAVDGMTLAQVHALYKGSTLTTDDDPTQTPATGSVVTKNGNYRYLTALNCFDSDNCTFDTRTWISKGSKILSK
ncbi:MAG: hypothetical protein U5L74_07240 [Ideonella sp.]|nr:hypothetical protein [Ideonella sp.]